MSDFIIGDKRFETGKKTYIMGILNVTPDSFSDGGRYVSVDNAVNAVEKMVADGADIIDIGGESTRPGHTQITAEEEIDRVVPVIRAVKDRIDVPISIDTYKYDVAKEAIAAGAEMLNSIWGFSKDERLAELVAKTGVSVCIMHNRDEIFSLDGSPEGKDMTDPDREKTGNNISDDLFMDTVMADLGVSLKIAEKYGIDKDRIIIDPGVGFGKTQEQNLIVIKYIKRLVDTGYPVLMAASRKSVIGYVLGTPVDEREEGTLAITLYAASQGCGMVRVHDVVKNARALRMWESVTHI